MPHGSPCRASFSAVTNRSSRVSVSPSERATFVIRATKTNEQQVPGGVALSLASSNPGW